MQRTDPRRLLATIALVAALLLPAWPAAAEEVLVAVASNFAPVAERLALRFEDATAHEVDVVAGSTGKLYAQIVRGAPFDVFLAADALRPSRLVEEGRALADTRRVYAVGRLVLWSADPARRAALSPATLRGDGFRRLAMANPDLAPYGAAARASLEAMRVLERLTPRLVFGENIGQAYALVASGNAELGFVAASQLEGRGRADGEGWLVPRAHHAPIRQELVLLDRASGNPAARAFVEFLSGPEARAEIRGAGYEVE